MSPPLFFPLRAGFTGNWKDAGAGGTADDTAAVQAAITAAGAGGTVVFRSGSTYTVAGIVAGFDNQIWIAFGAIIIMKAATNAQMVAMGTHRTLIYGGIWDGGGAATANAVDCIDYGSSAKSIVMEAEIRNAYRAGVNPNTSTRGILSNCWIHAIGQATVHDATRSGVLLNGATDFCAEGNTIEACQDIGISNIGTVRTNRARLLNNMIDQAAGTSNGTTIGIAVGGGTDASNTTATDWLIEGNTVINCPGNAIDLGSGQGCRVIGNVVGNSNAGIAQDSNSGNLNNRVIIEGNTIESTTSAFAIGPGIATNGGARIAHNKIRGVAGTASPASAGVFVSSGVRTGTPWSNTTQEVAIIGNDIEGGIGSGILLYSANVAGALYRVALIGNHCWNNARYGIELLGVVAGSVIDNSSFVGNILETNTLGAYLRDSTHINNPAVSLAAANIPVLTL